jgi:hypothetical protein
LRPKAQELLDVLAAHPSQSPPPFEKLVGDLRGAARGVAASSTASCSRSAPRTHVDGASRRSPARGRLRRPAV